MLIRCNLNPEHDSTEFKWRVSWGGMTYFVKSVSWLVPCWTAFVEDWGASAGYCIEAKGRPFLDEGCLVVGEERFVEFE